MKPLRVALVVKPSSDGFERENRLRGLFSYPVPEFTWEHFYLGKGFTWETSQWLGKFDLLLQEDRGSWGKYLGPLPKVILILDSIISDEHYWWRLEQAEQMDMTLVDQDRLERFPDSVRLSHCVNDHLFRPRENRDIDLNFRCANKKKVGDGTRQKLRLLFQDWANETGHNYVHKPAHPQPYAEDQGSSKIVANWPRTPDNRGHRVFNAMAGKACAVTGVLPELSDEERTPGVHYIEVEHWEDMPKVCGALLESGEWERIADNGYKLAMEKHTWTVRAKELRQILKERLGL